MDPRIRFLMVLASAIKNGAVKTIKQAMAFAKREFGEIDKDFTSKIINVFKKEGKTKKGDVVPIKKKEGIMATDEAADMVKGEINPKTHQMPNQKREFLGFPNRSVEAIVRTAARDVLEKAGLGPRIKGQDPIDMARQIYGDEILDALDNIAGELQEASSYPEISRILTEKKIYNFKPRQGLNVKQKGEIEDITAFDPKDRTPNAYGGIAGTLRLNRTGYVTGSGPKVINLVIKHGPEFKKFADMLFIKASNMIRQGKGMWKGLTEKQRIIQHDNLTKKVNTFQKEGTLEGVDQYFGVNAEKAFVEAQAKIKQSPADEIRREFPGITDDLVNNILTDKNPQRIEEVKATMNEALKMGEKGMGPDQIIDIFKKTPRTKNADGGLINILKL